MGTNLGLDNSLARHAFAGQLLVVMHLLESVCCGQSGKLKLTGQQLFHDELYILSTSFDIFELN